MIAEFESRILALIDGMVDHASDDELFASGYLRGHLTLAIAELESGDDHSAQAVHTTVSQSLEKAIGAGLHVTRRSDKAFTPHPTNTAKAGYPALTALPFNNFRTHNLFGFNAASVLASIGIGSSLICAARISAHSGAEHKPREPKAATIKRSS